MAARDVTAAQGLTYPVPAPRQRDGVETGGRAEPIRRRAADAGLVVLMTIGSFGLWTAVPLGGLWLASQLTDTITQLEAAPALVVVVGIPLAMTLGVKGLALLERRYLRPTEARRGSRVPAYRRSISDSGSGSDPTMLDRTMVVSVLAAAVAFAGWFVLFAGSSLLP